MSGYRLPTSAGKGFQMLKNAQIPEDQSVDEYVAELRAEVEAELIPHWRTPLPPNPTPAKELAAWDADGILLSRAFARVHARRQERQARLDFHRGEIERLS